MWEGVKGPNYDINHILPGRVSWIRSFNHWGWTSPPLLIEYLSRKEGKQINEWHSGPYNKLRLGCGKIRDYSFFFGGGEAKGSKLAKNIDNKSHFCQFSLFYTLSPFLFPFSPSFFKFWAWETGGGGRVNFEYAPDGIQSFLIDSPIMSNICVCLDSLPPALLQCLDSLPPALLQYIYKY